VLGLVAINPDVPPGRDVRCIISVSMLSEGWDATTVTHVVGLRPFGSQLLCEQVVGHALRRTSYAVDPQTKLFTEETAQIFGVPFQLIPFKVEGGKPQPPSPPANHVYAVPEKSQYEIEFPVVESYHDPGILRVKVNWDRIGELVLDPDQVPDDVLLRGLAAPDGRLIAYGPGAPGMQAAAPAARLFPRESKSNSRGVGASSFRRTAIPDPTTAGRIAHLSDYHKRLSLFLAFAPGAEIFRGPHIALRANSAPAASAVSLA
jgi:hypothetical protein